MKASVLFQLGFSCRYKFTDITLLALFVLGATVRLEIGFHAGGVLAHAALVFSFVWEDFVMYSFIMFPERKRQL